MSKGGALLGNGLFNRLVRVTHQADIHLTELRNFGEVSVVRLFGILRLDLPKGARERVMGGKPSQAFAYHSVHKRELDLAQTNGGGMTQLPTAS